MVARHHRISGLKALWSRRILSDSWAEKILWLAFALGMAAWLWRPVRYANDVWWHLATGRYILEHGILPLVDVFSFTVRDHPWINQSWLLQIIWYGFYRSGGSSGLILFKVLLIETALLFQWFRLRKWGVPWPWQWACLGAMFWASRYGWNERADLVSLWFLSALTLLQDQATSAGQRPRLLLTLGPILFCLWANSHGAFVLGLAVAGLHTLGVYLESRSRAPRLVFGLLVGIAATFVNPYGWRLHEATWKALVLLKGGFFTEWQRTPFAPLEAFWICWVLFWALFLVHSWRKRSFSIPEALVSIFLAWGAAGHVRNVPYFMVCAFPYMFRWIPVQGHVPAGRTLALAATLAFTAHSATGVQGGVSKDMFPIKACEFIERVNLPATFYNESGFGGYWIWRLGRRYPVFVDGRFHAVEGYIELYKAIHIAQSSWPDDWDRFLARYNVDAALVAYPDSAPLPSVFKLYFPRSRWALVYWDDVAILFVRRLPRYAHFIQQWEFRTIDPDGQLDYFIAQAKRSKRIARQLASDLQRNLQLHPDSRRTEIFWQALKGLHS